MKRMIDSELIESLNKDIQFDGIGNVTVGKNLEVGGTTKLNGGFTPIYSYNDNAGNTFNIYSEIDNGDGYTFFGDLNSTNIGIGYYTLDELDNIDTIEFLKMDSDGLSMYVGQDNYEKFITVYELTDEINKKQNKLYRHNLVLNNKYWKEYITDSNLKAASIQDLDTITHANNGTTLVLGPELLLMKQGATWKIGAETVTAVSDDVTQI